MGGLAVIYPPTATLESGSITPSHIQPFHLDQQFLQHPSSMNVTLMNTAAASMTPAVAMMQLHQMALQQQAAALMNMQLPTSNFIVMGAGGSVAAPELNSSSMAIPSIAPMVASAHASTSPVAMMKVGSPDHSILLLTKASTSAAGAAAHSHHNHHQQHDDSNSSNGDQQHAASIHDPAPCQHNNWDNLRAKSSIATLCCRDCSKKWKQRFPIKMLCPEFHMERVCAFGINCPFLHVHRYKSIEKSPNPVGHVTGATRNAGFANMALDVLAENPTLWPRDVVDQVRVRYIASQDDEIAAAPSSEGPRSVSSNGTSSPLTPQQRRASGFALLPASFFSRSSAVLRSTTNQAHTTVSDDDTHPAKAATTNEDMWAAPEQKDRCLPQRCALASMRPTARLSH